ncbi:MAG: hypothetical protein AAFY36_08955, partial [Bacteroidota bacterium]
LYQLFRAKGSEPLTTYMQLLPDGNRMFALATHRFLIKDEDVKQSDSVIYRLLARYADIK